MAQDPTPSTSGVSLDAPSSLRGPASILLGCGVAVIFLLLGIAACGTVGWGAFVRFGIASDLSEYTSRVMSADFAPEVRDPLIEQIDRIREKARNHAIPFLRWVDYDESISGILDDEVISEAELPLLQRELDRVEKEF